MESRNNSKKTNRSLRLEEDSGEAEIIQLLEKNEGNPVEIVGRKEPSNKNEFRTVLSQVVAVSVVNLILLDLGMILAFPTIVIPALSESTDDLHLSQEQASWLGSLAYIFQPLGSSISGFISEPIGRKTTLLYINIPLLVGWLLIRFATETAHLFIAAIIMGISIGFTDAPHITYLGEITQPKWRGVLISYAELSIGVGFFVVYLVGSFTDWRTASTLCCTIPIISMLLISRIPESPIWLLSKKRADDAKKSLCWLRGWVTLEVVNKEFSDLNCPFEAKISQRNATDANKTTIENARKNFIDKIVGTIGFNDILRKSVLRPLFLVSMYFGFSNFAGVANTRPYMVEILKEFGTSLDPILLTAISSVIGMVGSVMGMILVRKTGKRLLSIITMLGCAVTNGLISIYGYLLTDLRAPWIPAFLFILLNFLWSTGIGQIPWMLISEVFPYRGRSVASGIAAATAYIEAFVFIKTYYFFHQTFSISGVFAFYGSITLFGTLCIVLFLPETEGRSLAQIESDIENHFNRISKKLRKRKDNEPLKLRL